MQLLRLAYPDATNIEAGAAACGRASNRTRPSGRRGGGRISPRSRGRPLNEIALGKRLLQFGDAPVGDPGGTAVERLQLSQPLEVHQPRVADCKSIRFVELEICP